MNLKNGQNEISFEVEGSAPIVAQLFVWSDRANIVVSDIEGAILSRSGSSFKLLDWWAGADKYKSHAGVIKVK